MLLLLDDYVILTGELNFSADPSTKLASRPYDPRFAADQVTLNIEIFFIR